MMKKLPTLLRSWGRTERLHASPRLQHCGQGVQVRCSSMQLRVAERQHQTAPPNPSILQSSMPKALHGHAALPKLARLCLLILARSVGQHMPL